MADIVEITLTRDYFECDVIAESVRSRGYQVELVRDDGETGAQLPAMPGRLLVHAADVGAVREIIDASHPLDEDESAVEDFRKRGSLASEVRWVLMGVGFVIGLAFVYLLVT